MAFNDAMWGISGKIPPESDFFGGAFDVEDILAGDGFTPGYSKVLGEQVFKVTEPSEHPFTAKLTGRPVRAGAGWLERLVKRLGAGTVTPGEAKAGVMKRGGASGSIKSITAEDDLRYYDSEGKEFAYPSENLKGWIPVSLPSNLDIYDMFSQEGGFGQLNSMLVDNVKQAYDNALESEIQKHAINLCPFYEELGEVTGADMFTKIRDYVSKLKSDDYAFNQFAIEGGTLATADATFNDMYEHKAKEVVIFMNRIAYNKMMDDFATYPSPEYIKDIGAEFVLMDNAMVTPYASEAAMATDGFDDYGGLDPDTDMPMLGQVAPEVLIMDRRFCEYRPVIDAYRINISKNGAGDFTNEHMHFVGGLNVKPWAGAIALIRTPSEGGNGGDGDNAGEGGEATPTEG